MEGQAFGSSGQTAGGVDPHRIAEVIVRRADGTVRRGSGYRVADTAVLTAAHVTAEAIRIEVRFDADRDGQWSALAEDAWWDLDTDLAVLAFTPPPQAPPAAAVSYGRMADRRAVLEVHVAGFPRWKQRTRPDDSVYRELHDAAGTVAVLSNRRSSTLELTVSPSGSDPDPAVSPWEGMSGGAVWVGHRIIGVVAEHHPREGPGRLTAVRIDRCIEQVAGDARRALFELLAIRDEADLIEVTPAAAGQLARSGYLEQVRDIAPAQGLLGRDAELDELAAFCAGDGRYMWWQAEPWAGKTALMSTFVLDPPAGVDVVSFFVTARLATQSDSNAFTDALLEQLSAITGEAVPASLTPTTREAYYRALLEAAVQRCRASGRRLVLVIDGLDEDRGAVAGSGLASIASLLPKNTTADLMRTVVAGRPDPPIPRDVPHDHPLRTCRIRALDASPYAGKIAALARRELDELLTWDRSHRNIIGLITASGGGLTLHDLQELTGRPPFELDATLNGVFGRTVAGRTDTSIPDPEQVFLFTHEALRAEAVDRLGAVLLEQSRDRIHAWADTYRARRWPSGTPRYLLRGYPRMLQAEGDLARLVTLATDPARHNRMLDVTGGFVAAFAEINAAQDVILGSSDPDLLAMARLAIRRDDLADRSNYLPIDLPAVWVRLGNPVRAEAIARSMVRPNPHLLSALYSALTEAGEHDRAEALIARLPEKDINRFLPQVWSARVRAALAVGDDARAHALVRSSGSGEGLALIIRAAAAAGDADRVEAIASAFVDSAGLPLGLPAAVEALSDTGFADRARTVAHTISDPADRANALIVAKDYDGAEAAARSVSHPYQQARALTEVAKAVAAAGDHDRAEALARMIDNIDARVDALIAVARASAAGGDLERARTLSDTAEADANRIDEPERSAPMLIALAETAVSTGDHDQAVRLADAAGTALDWIFDPGRELPMLMTLATVLIAAGDHARFMDLVSTVEGDIRSSACVHDRHDRRGFRVIADTVIALARLLAGVGESIRAAGLVDVLVESVRDLPRNPYDRGYWADTYSPDGQADALITLVEIIAGAGDHDRAEAIAEQLTGVDDRTHALAAFAKAAVDAPDRAAAALTAAEALAWTRTNPHYTARDLIRLVRAVAAAGDQARAEAIAWTIADADRNYQADGVTAVAEAIAAAGDHDRAEALARRIADPYCQAKALITLARGATDSGAHRRAAALAKSAEKVARTIARADQRAGMLAILANAAAEAGDRNRARKLAKDARTASWGIEDSMWRQVAWANQVEALAAAGDHRLAEIWADEIDISAEEEARAWTAVMAAKIAAGRIGRAEAIARIIPTPYQASALAELAEGLARTGHLGKAEDVVRGITDPRWRAASLTVLARTVTAAGDQTRAAALFTDAWAAAQTVAAEHRATELIPLVQALAATGNPDWAEDVARTETDPDNQANVLIALARAVAATGDQHRAAHLATTAEIVAQTIEPDERRAAAFIELTEIVEPARARSLVARAFSAGRWSEPLNALARIDPASAAAIAVDYCARRVTNTQMH